MSCYLTTTGVVGGGGGQGAMPRDDGVMVGAKGTSLQE